MSDHWTKKGLCQTNPESCHMPLTHVDHREQGHSPCTLLEQLRYLQGSSAASWSAMGCASAPASAADLSEYNLQQLILFHMLTIIRCFGSAFIKWSQVTKCH